jgi:hypothetical protein
MRRKIKKYEHNLDIYLQFFESAIEKAGKTKKRTFVLDDEKIAES